MPTGCHTPTLQAGDLARLGAVEEPKGVAPSTCSSTWTMVVPWFALVE